MRTLPSSCLMLLTALACKPGEVQGPDADTVGTDDPLECEDELVAAVEWFEDDTTGSWSGSLEFGQTHVTSVPETRHAPPVIAERETLLLFTPDGAVDETADVRVTAWEGQTQLGTLPAQAPTDLPGILDQDLTDVALDPYSTQAWSVTLPWDWIREGVVLWIGTGTDDGVWVHEHELEGLGAPQRFTMTRSKIVLFGDESIDTSTHTAEQITRDYFGSLPVAELRWVDTTDWLVDEVVVETEDGYRMVSSEEERTSLTTDTSRWAILKHQFALRMSAANTGRGLVLNEGWEGDSSPYSFGTSVVMGWVVDEEGTASDIDDAGVAAGWTGWTAMWVDECGNTFIHEIGHSCTLQHFTSGTADSWGIGDEYPSDGQNMSTHPWGYDTTRRQFRTWYQVDGNGPVEGDDEGLNGKYDPMNGGESANSLTCFPQYTGYHAAQIQDWSQSSPTLADLDGVAGAWLWDQDAGAHQAYTVDSENQEPVLVDVPVVTLIGTLGGLEEQTQQTYPPIYSISGNVFAMPDPEDPDLDSGYEDARWFLQIHYGDGSSERALVDVGEVGTTELYVYALNLSADLDPVRAELYYSDTAWPSIDADGATLVHSRDIEVPEDSTLPPVVTAGHGAIANGSLTLTDWCTPDLDCESRDAQSSWRIAGGALTFRDPDGQIEDPQNCLEPDDYSILTVPVVNTDGDTNQVIVHGQRRVEAGGTTISVPLNDRTPWIDAADLTQSVRVWIPHEANVDLPEGSYRVDGSFSLEALLDGEVWTQVPIEIDLDVLEALEAPLDDGYWAGPVSQDDSSVYFQVADSSMGPDYGVWWDDWVDGVPQLSVPVLDVDSAEATTLYVDAYKVACDEWWDFNSAQGYEDGACDNYAVLYASEDNDHLESGHTYQSPGSSLLVIEAYRWHAPSAYTLLERYPLEVSYTAP